MPEYIMKRHAKRNEKIPALLPKEYHLQTIFHFWHFTW